MNMVASALRLRGNNIIRIVHVILAAHNPRNSRLLAELGLRHAGFDR